MLGPAAKPPMKYRQEGSGYVPEDFQAEKTHIIVSGQVFVEG
jgi:hypothetical protein